MKAEEVDLLLLDLNLPDIDGLEVSKKIKQEEIPVKIMALSMSHEERFVRGLLEAGVDGYVLKSSGKEELLKAIRTILEGGSFYSPEVRQAPMHDWGEDNEKSEGN